MEKAVNEIAKILANGKAVNSHIPSIILEENFDVKSLESLQENPSRIRTKVSVSSEKSFIEYVIDILPCLKAGEDVNHIYR
ncbi:DUF2303 family protein [Pasteurella multocida]